MAIFGQNPHSEWNESTFKAVLLYLEKTADFELRAIDVAL